MTDLYDFDEDRLDLLLAELDREAGSRSTRLGASQTSAGVLVAASSVVAGASAASGHALPLLYDLALLAYLASAVLGIIAIFPARGVDVSIQDLISGAGTYGKADLKRALVASNVAAQASTEAFLGRRYGLVIAGFIVLIVAWGLSMASSTSDLFGRSDAPLKVQIVSR